MDGDEHQRLIQEFNDSGVGVKVNTQIIPTYEEIAQGLITGLQTGDIPDATILSDVWWFRFYLASALADLTPLLVDADDYTPKLFDDYSRNGGQYGVPFARSMPILYYNADMLEKAGLSEDIFAKWSTFRDAASDLVDGSGASAAIGFGNAGHYGAWVLQGPVWAFGGRYSDEDFNILLTEEGAINCGEFFREFVQSQLATGVVDPEQDFTTGANATVLAGTGAIGNFTQATNFDFRTIFMPEELQFGACTGGAGISILKDTSDEKKQAAASFIDFMTNTANTTKWSTTTGYMPVRTSAIESDDFQAFLDDNPNNKRAVEQLSKTQPQDNARVFIPNGDQILGDGWDQILVKNTPAADAWEATKQTLDAEKQPVLKQIKELEG